MGLVLSHMLTCPEFHLIMERGWWLLKTVLVENFIRDALLDKAALFRPLHISFCRVRDSVHILQPEESYVKLFVA